MKELAEKLDSLQSLANQGASASAQARHLLARGGLQVVEKVDQREHYLVLVHSLFLFLLLYSILENRK